MHWSHGLTTIDLSLLATGLELAEPGLWHAKATEPISYPQEANEWCGDVEEHSFWFQHRNHCIVSIMKRFPPRGPVFDIGGGNGFVSVAMQEAGFQPVLVEPGVSGIQNARRRGLNPVVHATLETAGFRDGVLPAAGLFDVIEHIEDDARFLRSIHDLLAPRGILYLTAPAYNFLWSPDDDYAGHFRRYSLRTLRRTLHRSGFQILFQSYIFAFLPFAVLLFRTVPAWCGKRKNLNVEQQRREHAFRGGWRGRVLRAWSRWEVRRLEANRTIPFGGSCLIVASSSK